MKCKKNIILSLIIVCVIILICWFLQYNKIVGTVYGAEMNEIVIEDVVYVWATRPPCPYNGTDRQFHIGKGAWSDGTRVLDIYNLKGDENLDYLYARSGHEGQMYMRKSLELD